MVLCESEATLDYIASSRLVRLHSETLSQKIKNKKHGGPFAQPREILRKDSRAMLTPSLLKMWTRRPFPHPKSTKDCLVVTPISALSSSHRI